MSDTKQSATIKVSRVAFNKGLRVRFGVQAEPAVYAINDDRIIVVAYKPDANIRPRQRRPDPPNRWDGIVRVLESREEMR